jgi:hypothetical protein
MAIIKRTRSAQWPLVADFVFNYNDGFAVLATLNAASQDSNPRPTITDFGSKAQPTGMLSGATYVANTNAAANYFEMISLPLGAQVIGGDVQIEAPYVGPGTVTLAIGDAQSGAQYFTAATLKATNFTNQPTTMMMPSTTSNVLDFFCICCEIRKKIIMFSSRLRRIFISHIYSTLFANFYYKSFPHFLYSLNLYSYLQFRDNMLYLTS